MPPKRKVTATREELHRMYWGQRMNTRQIAEKYGVIPDAVRYWMIKYGIPRRNCYEAALQYPRKPFSGDGYEKAYLLGLRAGDIHARHQGRLIEASVGTTHPAMLKLFRKVFSNHGTVGTYPFKIHSYELGIYTSLDKSFSFLLQKPSSVPDWVQASDKAFYRFLAGYADAEGCWSIFRTRQYVGQIFVITTSDENILLQLNNGLIKRGFNSHLYRLNVAGKIRGYGKCTRNIYTLEIYARKDVCRLARILLHLSHHDEKIRKMQLILKCRRVKYWKDIESDVVELRQQVRREVSDFKRRIRDKWLERHRQRA